ncbi:MAG: L-serine ammonia-lyase, iron-sulfur-dependent, subunit alpha [Bacillota bacterium]|nr:L-serine ammonia-lyase, iron-sulfur-dependent, subunit alpha [Bacillota bacterium]
MKKQPASIFNDVIGPVMRGPSSSHTAAASRIGLLANQMVEGKLKKVLVEFHPKGSLATTYHGQGSDIGLVGGLLGYNTEDERLVNSISIAKEVGLDVSFNIVEYEATHPNTYRLKIFSDKEEISATAISTGGGMIKVENINGFTVEIAGDFYETLIFCSTNEVAKKVERTLEKEDFQVEYIQKSSKEIETLINLKTLKALDESLSSKLKEIDGVFLFMNLSPVLPILSSKDCDVPFLTAKEMLEKYGNNRSLYELALLYESKRGKISEDEVYSKMKKIVEIMDDSARKGLSGTDYEDRILGPQSHLIKEAMDNQKLLPGDLMNTVIGYITSMMEVKSSMGVIVAAPTAGSCGGLPGTIIGACDVMGLKVDDMVKGMLAAGMIGLFIAQSATFAAEVGGCQVECGAGSSMAAAGLVQLMGGSSKQGVDAASMALQNVMGMICDPVGDRVEVPCLGKNVMAGANAIACANMALAGFDKVIPLDETIDSMYKVGQMLPSELRCTGKGGLSVTPTGIKIFEEMN